MTDGNAFLDDLRGRIDAWFTATGAQRTGGAYMAIKSAVLLSSFFGLYALILLGGFGPWTSLLLAVAFGVSAALIAFNIPHDALHGALSRRAWVNRLGGYAFNLVGLNAYTWWVKHNVAHHGFPNVIGRDPDIDGAPILRLSEDDPIRPWHRWQHLYAPFAYVLLGLVFVAVMDFRILFDRGLAARHGLKHAPRQVVILFATKAFYLGYTLVLPLLVLPFPAWQVVFGWLVVHGVVGVLSGLVLLPSHCMEHTSYARVDASGAMDRDWVVHTLQSTLDFARGDVVVAWFLGGFNTNVVHHLFPNISHRHLGALSRILVETAADHGLPYHETTLRGAVGSHLRFLRRMGRA